MLASIYLPYIFCPAFPIRIKSDLKPLIDSIDPTVEPVHKIYLFAFTSVHKEDWYFALRKATNHHGSDKLRRAAEQHRKWIEKLQQEMPLLRMETPLAAVNGTREQKNKTCFNVLFF